MIEAMFSWLAGEQAAENSEAAGGSPKPHRVSLQRSPEVEAEIRVGSLPHVARSHALQSAQSNADHRLSMPKSRGIEKYINPIFLSSKLLLSSERIRQQTGLHSTSSKISVTRTSGTTLCL